MGQRKTPRKEDTSLPGETLGADVSVLASMSHEEEVMAEANSRRAESEANARTRAAQAVHDVEYNDAVRALIAQAGLT